MNRFDLLEIDDHVAPAAPQYAAPVAGEPAAPALLASVDQDARVRAVAVDDAIRQHGLAFASPTFFAWGTKGAWGNKAARARAALHAMPLHAELAEQARSVVDAEQRAGAVAYLDSIGYLPTDRLTIDKFYGATCSPQALKHLLSRADAPGGSYLVNGRLPGDLRSAHVNHWLDLRNKAEAQSNADARSDALSRGKPAPVPDRQEVKLLSKLTPGGDRALYGAVGPRYPHGYGMDRVIADVQGMFPGEARGALFYDASTTRWRVDAAVGAEFEPCVGDVYRLGVRYGAHDAGGGSYWADLYGIRVRCVNFTKIHGLKKLGRVRHVGTIEDLQQRVRALIEVGADAMASYSEAVREANEQAIVDRGLSGPGDARTVFEYLIAGGYAPAPGGDKTGAADAYMNAWLQEPGHTRLDFVNAITRAAHESPWSSPWVTEELEDAAGKLLYQRLVIQADKLDA